MGQESFMSPAFSQDILMLKSYEKRLQVYLTAEEQRKVNSLDPQIFAASLY